MLQPIIIVGAGLAGYQLAKEFRKLDTTTPLIILTADDGRYYSKPLLSTALTNGKTPDLLHTASSDMMAQQLNAMIHTHVTVTAIDTVQCCVVANDEKFSYSKLVLACGADVIKPQLAGDAVDDVLSINHIYHYTEFRDLIQNKKRIAILGAGLIGSEFANDLSNAEYDVHVIALGSAPLDLLVPPEVGKLLQAALESNGVHFHFNTTVNAVDKMENDVYCLELSNGSELEVDFVLSAIGLRPHVALAQQARLNVNRGIVVNRYLETSEKEIYALGDCAEVEGHVLPYIAPLLSCSRALAHTLAGNRTAVDYPAMPVVVKTPAHPVVVCPPPKNTEGAWKIENDENNVRALFYDKKNVLRGFVLTNNAVKERAVLAKQLPGLLT